MKHQFLIENISPLYKSKQFDSRFLTKDLESFSQINSLITLRKVIDIKSNSIDKDPSYMNFGGTNPTVLKYFKNHVQGIRTSDNGKKFIDSDKLAKGWVVEMEYREKMYGDKLHIVPIGTPKFVGYINKEKVNKLDVKVHQLF